MRKFDEMIYTPKDLKDEVLNHQVDYVNHFMRKENLLLHFTFG